ncbi:hypothetical protein CY35_08G115300 [Sphagnum magellanicum]|nr:hypothetical protein CY35_08G115300 [Sphagnum magellanicum]
MAGKSHKNNKGKAKTGVVVGKPLSSTDTTTTTVGVREVPVLASATGLPELGLKRPAKPVPTAAAAGAVPVVVESSSSPGVKESIVPEEVAASNGKQEGTTTLAEAVPASTAPQETEVPEKAMAASKDEDSSEHSGGEGEAELRLYPITVKGPGGEQLELQINPGDSVMDLRQFLLDAPETCFYTCYDLILKAADGVRYHLAEYLEIGEVADVAAGGCSLEMVNAMYDDRSVRSHVRRARDLISTASIHSSLSTALASEYETKQADATGNGDENEASSSSSDSKPKVPNDKQTGAMKGEAAELDGGLGFMEDSVGLLGALVSVPIVEDSPCVDTIAFSSFNPVPGYRRLLGDLIYLDVVSAEGEKYCITAHTRGFYINRSTGNVLDAQPSKPVKEATTLVGLLRQVSEKFATGFAETLERKASGHPFENVPVLLPPNSWLGPYPTPLHKRDIARAEDALMVPYGTEIVGMQRDWNEELQSCREFSRESLQDRIMRDRALYKVNCDFVEAATKGARAVIGRCIPPINPTDPDRFHMYVHNNIFFSFAVDGDFALMQQLREQELRQQTERDDKEADTRENGDVVTAVSGEAAVPPEPETTELPSGETGLKEDSSVEAGAPSETPPAPVVESEQATYASANNDLKGTKAYNNADVAGLYTLAMAIVDFRGHRVVAQSIIPGILQGDKTESLLYGSVDNGKKIAWNEKFHSKALEAGKLLHIKEHTVLDAAGKGITLCAPVECKGIVGSDDRHYMLDLMRTTPRDINYTGPGSRLCVLRPELVAVFCQVEALERVKKRKAEGDQTDEKTLLEEELPKIVLNPNVFTDFKVSGDPEDIAADEELVRKAGQYLVDTVLPKLVVDLSSLEVSPMDGPTLTDALHAHGINVRYLGKVAKQTENLPHVWDLCIVEMVIRSAKHILKGVLRETLDQDVGGAIAHFFNCLVGPETAPSNSEVTVVSNGKPEKSEANSEEVATEIQPSYLCITPTLVWTDIHEGVKFKYQMGVALSARTYCFDADVPFETSDIVDLQAVVKHLSPVCGDARDLLESGKVRLAQVGLPTRVKLLGTPQLPQWFRLHQGKLNEAYELFTEAFTILQQVCGPMHREVANCCRYLAMVLYHAGDMAGAIMQQHKELIINERCLGPDHPDTAHSYGNMALFYHGLNQTELALRHMARTLLLLNVSCGSDHPDVAATFINIAMMYQDIGKMNVALRYLQEALKRNERLLGHEHIQTAVCYHALAIAFNCMGAYKLSLQHERSTYNILVKQLGEEDSRTRESANWIKTFQIRENQAHAQKQRGQQSMSIAAVQKAAEALKARPDLVQAFQAAAASASASQGPLGKGAGASYNAADILPRSRGTDERAARAANEVRKKAAARGLNVRPQAGVPGQSIPPLGDLLSLINGGVAGKAPVASSSSASSTARGAGKTIPQPRPESSGKKGGISTNSNSVVRPTPVAQAVIGSVDGTAAVVGPSPSGPSPLGLGGGLGGLDSKKKKPRSKNPA